MDESMNNAPESGSKMGLIIGAIVLALVAAGGYYYWSTQMTQPATSTTPAAMEADDVEGENTEMDMAVTATPAPAGSESATAVMENGAQTITIDAGNFYFKPNEIRVKAGTPVKITLNNVQGFHDFVIEELDVKSQQITANNKTTVEFTPTEKGSYEYYCSVGQHRQMGMKGMLIVE